MKVNFNSGVKKRKLNIFYIITVFLVIVLFMGCSFSYFILYQRFTGLIEKNKNIQENYNKYLFQEKKYLELREQLSSLNKNRDWVNLDLSCFEILKEIGYVIPQYIFLKQIRINEKTISLEGAAKKNDLVIGLVENLNKSDLFSQCQISFINKELKNQFNFEIEGYINQ